MSADDSELFTTGLLFVCTGNICRSPLGAAILRQRLREAGVDDHYNVDSAGVTGHHEGEFYDARSRAVAKHHGIPMSGRARAVRTSDFSTFQLILAADNSHLTQLRQQARKLRKEEFEAHHARIRPHVYQAQMPREIEIRLIGEWLDPRNPPEIPDPYYGGTDGFEQVFDMLDRACAALLRDLEARRGTR